MRLKRHKTTRTRPNKCLDCGADITAAQPTPDMPDDSPPSPGDIAICFYCSHVQAYADDLTLRPLTEAEVIEIAGDQTIVRAVRAIVNFNKREAGR